MADNNLRIVVERNPPQSKLSELNIKCWPKWGCSPGKYQLKFDAEETCYLLKGKVRVYPKGSSEFVEFGAGDLVIIPKGLSCTWDVSIAVDKHYKFESSSPSPTRPSSSSAAADSSMVALVVLLLLLSLRIMDMQWMI